MAAWALSIAPSMSWYSSGNQEQPLTSTILSLANTAATVATSGIMPASTFRSGRMDELQMHPTVKPVALVVDAIKDCSKQGDIVLDPFCGSGTILIAAERTGRKARALEIDPSYVDVAIRRWEELTGKSATLSTGETFEQITEGRTVEAPDMTPVEAAHQIGGYHVGAL